MLNQRQQVILQIIQTEEICTQQELRERLSQEGVAVTQATVSRDIQLLGLVKVRTPEGKNRYMRPEEYALARSDSDAQLQSFQNVMREAVLSLDTAMNIVVLKCKEGFAGAVCAGFDELQFDGVVGTLAGDDTLFVLMRSAEQTDAMMERLRAWVSGERTE